MDLNELMQELVKYLNDNFIKFSTEVLSNDEYLIKMNDKIYQLFLPNNEDIYFDDKFCWDCDRTDYDGYIFKFGGVWYTINKGDEMAPKLTRVKWIGDIDIDGYEDFMPGYFLGVHGPFELLNGTSSYSDWCKKAKFLKIKKLGLCEKGTLAGAFKFQSACKKAKISPIFGMEVPIKNEKKDLFYSIKVFAKNEEGWLNLLRINKLINVDGSGYINEEDFIENRKNLINILDPKSIDYDNLPSAWRTMFSHQFYYQFDTVIYEKEDRDEWYLKNLKKFFNSKIKPIAMYDAYYIEKEYSLLQPLLNRIAGKTNYESKNQYFKNNYEYFEEFQKLFKSGDFDKFIETYSQSFENLIEVCESCNYEIQTEKRHLPRYTMTKEEHKLYSNNIEMFEELIYKGLEDNIDLLNEYGDAVVGERIQREIETIEYGDVVDYFLILRDVINWCNSNNILLGAGRGSAAGSLVTYLLGITRVDPLRYDLLFERFLNKGRIKVSLPDIDSDFPGEQRSLIKEYMEKRFGETQVCAVGTYTTLQLKAALTDLSKLYGVSIPIIRSLSKRINGLDDKTIEDFLKLACRDNEVKSFVHKYPELINAIFLLLGQPKAASIHACAMMIFPDEKTLYEWCPVRKQKDLIVSEWEGGELDEAGFLKEDILGIEQLDKFTDILNLIEKNTGKRIDLYKDIPKDDKRVFEFFKKGWLGDVFHFGAKGLSSYCIKMQPISIDELSDCAALYRPGVMENNYHNEYLLRRSGKREVDYHTGTENILSQTYGLFVYQEQVMALMNKLAGMDLVTCDTARKAMGKKKIDVIKSLEQTFIDGYCKNHKVTKEYAKDFWEEIVKASSYLFNKSHSVSYSINGYNSLWLKVHYPIEFWSVTFSRASKDDYPFYINEINQSDNIKLNPVDINKSGIHIIADKNDNSLYWSINAVNQVGEKAQDQIIKERSENGQYFSLEEFIDRHNFKNSAVNKSVIENLIYSGAFDELEKSPNYINEYKLRESLLLSYRANNKIKIDKTKDEYELALLKEKTSENWWWQLQQKKRSGFSFFDYKYLVEKYLKKGNNQGIFSDLKNIEELADGYKLAMIGGYVLEYEEKVSRKGTFARIILESNYEIIRVVIYAEIFDECKDLVRTSEKNLLLLSGKILWSDFEGCYVLQTTRNSEFVKLTLA